MRLDAFTRVGGKGWLVLAALGIVGLGVVLAVNMLWATVTFVKPKVPAKDAWAVALSEGEQLFNDRK